MAKNTLLLTLGLLTGRLLSLILFKKMTPLLGPVGMGIWVTATDLVSILMIVTNYGLGNLITREITRARGMTLPILWSALRLRWLLATVCYLFLLLFVDAAGFETLARQAILLTAISLFIESTAMACDSVLQAHEKVQYQTAGQVVSAVVYFVLGWFWLEAGHGILGVIWANLISRLVRLTVMAPLMFWRTGPWRWRDPAGGDSPGLRQLIKLGLPLCLAMTFGIVYNKIDTVMLNRMIGDAAAGIYGVGHRALDIMNIVPNLFGTALFPAMARYGMQTAGDAVRLGERALRFMMTAVIPLTLFLCFVAGPIIHWFDDSPAFADSIPVLMIVIWALPLYGANVILNRLLLTANRERAFIRIGLVPMLVNIVLNALLIPRYSYYGASAATVVSAGVSFLMHVHSLRGSDYVPALRRALLRPTVATVAAWLAAVLVLHLVAPQWGAGWFGLPVQAGWGPFLAAVALLAGLYVLAIVALRVIGRDDIALLRDLFR